MSISQQEYKRRYAAIREIMKKDGLDCLLVFGLSDDFNRGNIRYITGSGRGGCCIFPLEDNPVLLAAPGPSTSPKLSRTISALDLLELKETTNFVEQAVTELTRFDRGNKIGIIGMACITVPMYTAVKNKFKGRLIDTANLLEPLRVVKSAEEIEKTKTAASIADEVYARLRKMVKPGVREFEVYSVVKQTAYEMGCEYSFDLIDAAGTTMNMSFFPTIDTLEANGTLFMEITPSYDGYYAQLPLTLPVTEYPAAVRPMVSAWSKADKAVREILRPGTKVSDLYHLLVNTVRDNGFISPYRPGHSIGLDALDFWSITAENHALLKPGMVLAIHPCVLLEDGGDACGMGYTYIITDDGFDKLSKIDLAEELIGE
ncbi:M24 family metallopeptidase [Chloroflexota bacterium]